MDKKYVVVKSDKLSSFYEQRYVVVDASTGEVLDDAQGYGYKSVKKAYSAYAYKTRDKTKDAERKKKHKLVQEWCKEHKQFVNSLEDDAFCIAKGSYAPNDVFNATWIRKRFQEEGYVVPFTPSEFLRYWNRPLKK